MRTVAGGGVLGDCWEPPKHQAPLIEVTHTPFRLRKMPGLPGVGGRRRQDSLLAQLPGNVTALEALEMVEAASQPASSFTDPLAPIGQCVCAARL